MSEFKLHPWEVPVGCLEPLCAPADGEREIIRRGAKANAKFRQVEVAKTEFWLFVQPTDESDDNYVVCRNYGDALPPQVHIGSNRKPSEAFSRPLSNSMCLSRFVHLDVPEKPVAIFSEYWNGWHNMRVRVHPFQVPAHSEHLTSTYLHNWLQNEWRNPESEVRFAWQWIQWDSDSRGLFLDETAPGWREKSVEMEELVSLIALSESRLTPDMEWMIGDDFAVSSISPCEAPGSSPPEIPVDLETRFALWRELLLLQFPIVQTFQNVPVCARRALESRFSVAIRGQDTTAHERLEATLNLRDWLQKHHASAELLALLSR